jgi:hypothetical protein
MYAIRKLSMKSLEKKKYSPLKREEKRKKNIKF